VDRGEHPCELRWVSELEMAAPPPGSRGGRFDFVRSSAHLSSKVWFRTDARLNKSYEPNFNALRLMERCADEVTLMLAEKFMLVLEALRRNSDGSGVVVSTTPHVPVILPVKK
jgi:hypothetical protein